MNNAMNNAMNNGLKKTSSKNAAVKRFFLLVVCAAAGPAAIGFAEAKNLRIENKRDVVLSELVITSKDSGVAASFVLTRDLAAGRVTTKQVPRDACLYDVKGKFSDDSTLAAEDMDLCRQNTLRLVK